MSIMEAACILHCCTDPKETLSKVTAKQFSTSQFYAEQWSEIPGHQLRNIALVRLTLPAYNENDELTVHYSCYKKFCSKVQLERAKKRAGANEESPSTKRLRSQSQLRITSPILPPVCIICQKENRYTNQRHKTTKVPLSKAETITAGALIKAATAKEDVRLLGLFSGGDCVALEARYHRDCFRNYTRPIKSKSKDSDTEESAALYQESYAAFRKDVIDKKLIRRKQIYKLTTLTRIFRKTINKTENLSLATYRAENLKRRLVRDYPDLVIERCGGKRKGIVVFSADAIHGDEEDSDLTESESHSSSSDDDFNLSNVVLQESTSELFMGNLQVRSALDDHKYKLPWPLLGADIDLEKCSAAVPDDLVTFITNLTSGKDESKDKVKVLSICQDIMTLNSKTICTPKGLALGLSLKHMAGSKEIITMLHKLGHCASYDSIRSYETALANIALAQSNSLPDGFVPGSMATLVWDNIDFLEETKSGRGTTHHTNGIMIQVRQQMAASQPTVSFAPRGKARAVIPVSTVIVPLPHHQKSGPSHLVDFQLPVVTVSDFHNSNVLEFVFLLARTQEDTVTPNWTGFNKTTRAGISAPQSNVHYLPVIESPPTNLDTVNHVLQKTIDMADKLDVESVVAVFDQAIYCKAQQIRFVNPVVQQRIVLRMGEFHTVMTFLGVIGKRFEDSGMKELLVEAQVVAEGSAKGVMNGHSYNRSIRCNKLLMEALYDLLLEEFSKSDEQGNSVDKLGSDIVSVVRSSEDFRIKCGSEEVSNMYQAFVLFIGRRCEENQTFKFWYSYIEMVKLCLTFIRATRESDWNLHLRCLRSMIPWFFAYDKPNYSRYASLYYCEMINLNHTHPMIANAFVEERGTFTYQAGHHRPFSSIACDQAIEQTVNRHSKSKGGIVGFTKTQSASQRWTLTQPHRTAIYEAMKELTGMSTEMFDQHEQSKASWSADTDMRQQLKETISSRVNPFSHSENKLISVTSGKEAPEDVVTALETAQNVGEQRFEEFVNSRFKSQEVAFSAPVKAVKSKTFGSLKVSAKRSKTNSVKCSKKLFDRLLIVSQQRHVDIREVLSFSLGDVSWSLATADGHPLKTVKSAYMAAIETKLDDCNLTAPEIKPCALIIDAMAEIQCLKPPSTFGELANQLLRKLYLMAGSYGATRVDFVCDTYPKLSIKGIERARRTVTGQQRVTLYGPTQNIPVNFKSFLADGNNKEALVRFLVNSWATSSTATELILFVGYDSACSLLSYSNGTCVRTDVPELASDHEEADTRMLQHAKHAADVEHYEKVVIKCQDTDVFVMSVSVGCEFPQLIMSMGKGDKARLINSTKAATQLSPRLAKALLAGHALSGCDSTSAFYGKGKKKMFNLICNNERFHELLIKFGGSFDVDESVIAQLEEFVCLLYGVDGCDLNKARYTVYCSPSRTTESSLPPTKDEFFLHAKRSWYQTAIWRSCLKSLIRPPSPTAYGWVEKDGFLQVLWMTQKPAPKRVLEVMYCRCQKGCQSGRCGCRQNSLKCTDLCQCLECVNGDRDSDADATDSDSSDEESRAEQ